MRIEPVCNQGSVRFATGIGVSYTRTILLRFDSAAGIDLAMRLTRRARRDTTSVMQEPQHTPLGVAFFGADCAPAGDCRMRGTVDGRLIGLRAGPAEVRRALPLDMPALVARLRAADSAAADRRVSRAR